jgi:hypothetical protein
LDVSSSFQLISFEGGDGMEFSEMGEHKRWLFPNEGASGNGNNNP